MCYTPIGVSYKRTYEGKDQGFDSLGHGEIITQHGNDDKARARCTDEREEKDRDNPMAFVHEPGPVGKEGEAGYAGAGDHDVVCANPCPVSTMMKTVWIGSLYISGRLTVDAEKAKVLFKVCTVVAELPNEEVDRHDDV